MTHVSAHKRERKPKASYEEMFDNLQRREVVLDTLADKDKDCPVCGTQMVPIGTETVRTELVFHPAYPERVDYMAVTCECPSCKDSTEPQFVKDEGAAPLCGTLVALQKVDFQIPLIHEFSLLLLFRGRGHPPPASVSPYTWTGIFK